MSKPIYKLYHRSSSVFVINMEDLPILNMEGVTFLDKALVLADHNIALEAALSEKGIRVRNANVHGPDGVGGYLLNFAGHRMLTRENNLYDMPSGFEVKIERKATFEVDPQYYFVAIILPIHSSSEQKPADKINVPSVFSNTPPQQFEAPTQSNSVGQSAEEQDELWKQVFDLFGLRMVNHQYIDSLILKVKSEGYKITRIK